MKVVVTHYSPDFDALAACWLIKRYLTGWSKADIKFVPAGETLEEKLVDSQENIIHVDTGLGKFDHHQTNEKTSATKLVFEYLKEKNLINKKELFPLERMVEVITMIDHFNEVFLPEPTADIYDFNLYQMIEGLKNIIQNDFKTCEVVFPLFDAVFIGFKNKVRAEYEIKKGLVFQSKWGKSLAMENGVEESIKLAQKKGYSLVIRKNSENGMIRIKARPDTKYGLDDLYSKLKSIDPKATWYLHPSKRILLNGSMKNPKTKPSSLPLRRIIEIVRSF